MIKVLISLTLALITAAAIQAQATEFSYQGKLNVSNAPANGSYDIQFRLYDAPSGGNLVGQPTQMNNMSVVDGIFSVTLDFGQVWTGAARFLDLSVRVSGNGAFTTLTPRQMIKFTPYAMHATDAFTAANATTAANASLLEGMPASQFVQTNDTRLSDARQPLPGSANYIQNSAAPQIGANFNVSGNGVAGGTLSGGTVNTSTQYNIAGNRMLSIPGVSNTFVGASTGAANTTGALNAFVGSNAGAANTTGSNNVFAGASAGVVNQTGSLNTFVGSSSGKSNVSGSNNSFFGYNAGSLSTGHNNSFFGSGTGLSNGSGFQNSYFGKDAGFSGGGGNNNAFFGYQAGYGTTSNLNSFFGSGAGQSNTIGTSNTFVGYKAGRDNVDGNDNTFAGNQAGLNNESGVFNSFVGSGAGGQNVSGGANTFLGWNAGNSNATGANNTTIGAESDVLNSNLFNATAIGFRAGVAQSNSIVLGSINGVNGSIVDTNVGIGTATPAERLTIQTASNNYGWVHTQGSITMGSFVGGTGANPYGGWIGTKTNHPLNFFVNGANQGAPAMTIETAGWVKLYNVDIGGSGPSLCLNASQRISFCSSSLRYKTNIAAFTPGLSMVKQLRPITFDWKDGAGRDVGFGAEDVAKVNDLLVIHNKQGEVEGVKYDRISAVLVNAVKEQQAMIDEQRALIVQLKRRLDRIEKSVAAGRTRKGRR